MRTKKLGLYVFPITGAKDTQISELQQGEYAKVPYSTVDFTVNPDPDLGKSVWP